MFLNNPSSVSRDAKCRYRDGLSVREEAQAMGLQHFCICFQLARRFCGRKPFLDDRPRDAGDVGSDRGSSDVDLIS